MQTLKDLILAQTPKPINNRPVKVDWQNRGNFNPEILEAKNAKLWAQLKKEKQLRETLNLMDFKEFCATLANIFQQDENDFYLCKASAAQGGIFSAIEFDKNFPNYLEWRNQKSLS